MASEIPSPSMYTSSDEDPNKVAYYRDIPELLNNSSKNVDTLQWEESSYQHERGAMSHRTIWNEPRNDDESGASNKLDGKTDETAREFWFCENSELNTLQWEESSYQHESGAMSRTVCLTYSALMYVWTKNENSWGHASLWLDDGYNTYISWYPQANKSTNISNIQKIQRKIRNELPESYEEDVKKFIKRYCTHVFLITESDIKITKIRDWWISYREKPYNAVTNNCCHVVTMALNNGELKEKPTFYTPGYMIKLGQKLDERKSL